MARRRRSKGLGDKVEQFTKATGIKKVVDAISEATGIDCGCEERKELLNKLFPRKDPECLTEDEYNTYKGIREEIKRKISPTNQKVLLSIYNRAFKTRYEEVCACNAPLWRQIVKDLDNLVIAYEGD